ncbi:MAG: hypothetical protein ACRCXM_04545 [Beijerinckiaceae bacterium]
MPVETLSKPAGKWCNFCDAGGVGCKTWQLRPKQCRDFVCGWLGNENLGAEWKPDTAKFLLAPEYEGRCLTVYSDGSAATSWKRSPYYAVLKQIATFQLRHGHVLMAVDGDRRTLILPDTEVEIGKRGDQFNWTVHQTGAPHEPHFDVRMTQTAAKSQAA